MSYYFRKYEFMDPDSEVLARGGIAAIATFLYSP